MKGEDDEAMEFPGKKPQVKTFEDIDFDDLPSAHSRDNISQLDSISDDQEPQQHYIDTPQKNKQTPRDLIDYKNEISFNSEENS